MVADRQRETRAERAVALRARPDLVARLQHYRGRRCWGVKDPVALRYFHLRDEEYFILKSLDGQASADQIRRKFEQRFAPRRLDLGHLHAFFGLLYRQGLLLADAPGQAEPLLRRRGEQARHTAFAALGNVLALRLRGVDPERFLAWLYPLCRWLFTSASLVGGGLLAVSALLLVAVEFDVLRSRLPEFQAFFSPQNLLWLAVAVGLTKVIHELAHGLTCRHFGGECHEIGVMLLVFTPCLYCNVSDAWMLPDKWQRAAIGMAGMAAEIVLASGCTFLWWFTEPGPLNSLLLNIMVVCSVSTLLLNGNPLLRFDGYYVLSDLLEVPNLQPQSNAIVFRYVQKWLLGIEPRASDAALGHTPRWIALYALASTIYRLLVIVTILWLCHRVLRVYQLETLAQLLTVFVVGGLLAGPLWRAAKFFQDPGERRRLRGHEALGRQACCWCWA